jgi:signal transduction histidine kinase
MSTEINMDMAHCMIQLKIWKRAEEHLERALQLAKRHKVNRHLHRAYLLQLELVLEKGDKISALQAHQQCKEIISTDAEVAGQKLYLELLAHNRGIELVEKIEPKTITEHIRLLIPKGSRKILKLFSEQISIYFSKIGNRRFANWALRTAFQARAKLKYLDSSAVSWRVRDQIELHELRKENARLRKDLQVKRRLADEWAHDLREPVNNIKGFSRLLLSKIDSEPQLEYSKYIHRAAEQLDEQLRGMAEYASTQRSEHKTEDVDLNDVLRVVHDNLQEHIRQEDVLVLVQGLPQVQGYKPRLTRLFQNLLSNAIKFRHPVRQPEITVHWHVESDDYVFEVHDNGLGIPEKDQNRIFEPFERLEQEEEIPGSGIGLATCQRIVEAHGGRIWVQPKSGGGSIFSFTLPKKIKLGKNSGQQSANSGASS